MDGFVKLVVILGGISAITGNRPDGPFGGGDEGDLSPFQGGYPELVGHRNEGVGSDQTSFENKHRNKFQSRRRTKGFRGGDDFEKERFRMGNDFDGGSSTREHGVSGRSYEESRSKERTGPRVGIGSNGKRFQVGGNGRGVGGGRRSVGLKFGGRNQGISRIQRPVAAVKTRRERLNSIYDDNDKPEGKKFEEYTPQKEADHMETPSGEHRDGARGGGDITKEIASSTDAYQDSTGKLDIIPPYMKTAFDEVPKEPAPPSYPREEKEAFRPRTGRRFHGDQEHSNTEENSWGFVKERRARAFPQEHLRSNRKLGKLRRRLRPTPGPEPKTDKTEEEHPAESYLNGPLEGRSGPGLNRRNRKPSSQGRRLGAFGSPYHKRPYGHPNPTPYARRPNRPHPRPSPLDSFSTPYRPYPRPYEHSNPKPYDYSGQNFGDVDPSNSGSYEPLRTKRAHADPYRSGPLGPFNPNPYFPPKSRSPSHLRSFNPARLNRRRQQPRPAPHLRSPSIPEPFNPYNSMSNPSNLRPDYIVNNRFGNENPRQPYNNSAPRRQRPRPYSSESRQYIRYPPQNFPDYNSPRPSNFQRSPYRPRPRNPGPGRFGSNIQNRYPRGPSQDYLYPPAFDRNYY